MRRSSFVPRAAVGLALAFGGGAIAFTGCGNIVADRCDQICSCENCGDRARQECETKADADANIADAYGCTALLEPYWDCQVQKHECTDHHYQDDDKECKVEFDQYNECLEKSSSREQPYRGPAE